MQSRSLTLVDQSNLGGHRGHDHMVVGLTTYAISTYDH
jgi:hypothetical protein